jgi:nucleoside-diphosphate-sugar epimerase
MAAAPRTTVLVTGSQGKVGRHVVATLARRGIHVVGVDLVRGVYDTWGGVESGWPETYMQADLTDAGAVYSCVARFSPAAVVHVAAIPDPTHNPPHVVFQTNIVSTFNVVEACVRLRVPRLVNISSETVPGFFFPERIATTAAGVPSGVPAYVPVDEAHPIHPQDPYALSKHFGEQLCDAAVLRSDLAVITIRPSWCQDAGNVARNIGPLVRDFDAPNAGFLAYICIADLAEAITLAALNTTLRGHEVFYIAADDAAGGHDLAAWAKAKYGDTVPVRALARADASGLDCAKAKRLLGWAPKLTWRDFLTAGGELRGDAPK